MKHNLFIILMAVCMATILVLNSGCGIKDSLKDTKTEAESVEVSVSSSKGSFLEKLFGKRRSRSICIVKDRSASNLDSPERNRRNLDGLIQVLQDAHITKDDDVRIALVDEEVQWLHIPYRSDHTKVREILEQEFKVREFSYGTTVFTALKGCTSAFKAGKAQGKQAVLIVETDGYEEKSKSAKLTYNPKDVLLGLSQVMEKSDGIVIANIVEKNIIKFDSPDFNAKEINNIFLKRNMYDLTMTDAPLELNVAVRKVFKGGIQ